MNNNKFKMRLENDVEYTKSNLKQFMIERESVISRILNTMPDLYLHVNDKNIILDCFGHNNLNCELFSDECIGKSIINIIPDDILSIYYNAIDKCKRTKILLEKEITIKECDNNKYFDCKLIPLFKNQFVIVVRDISHKKWMEVALKESEKKYKMIFNICPNYIFIMNEELNKILDANSAFLSKYNIDKDELNGLKISDVFNNMNDTVYKNIINKINETKVEFDFDSSSKDKNGKIFYLKNRCIPIIKNNKNKFILFFSQDITSEKNIKILNEEVEEERNKVQFFANISHEFKTPINVISSGIQLMDLYAKQIDNSIYTEKLKNLEHNMLINCYRLTRLVNNLIDMTKINTGYIDFKPENCDIVKLIKSICLSIQEYAEAKNLSLIVKSSINKLIIACDVEKIEKIILNLLSNAIKFTNKGDSITVNILKSPDNFLLISIKDTGIGIEQKDLDLIFERFKQVSKRNSNNKNGSGIGLSLVKYLVELHQGYVTVKSEYGKGTEFLIHLPIYTLNKMKLN